MKKIFIMAALLMTCLVASAQQEDKETIHSIAAISHKADWYGVQARLWQQEVNKDPKNEWAWRNFFRATYYSDLLTGAFGQDSDHSATADVMQRMEMTLPDSYVLNLSKERFCLKDDSMALTHKTLYRAIELMPKDAFAEDIEYLACHLWYNDPDNASLGRLFKLSYQKNCTPEAIVRYNWNMLMSMEPDAIYFGNGDNILQPSRMLQEALDVRRDVTIIPISFLFVDEFRQYIETRLGIKPFEVTRDYSTMGNDWTKQYYADVIMHITSESKRPAYFFPDVLAHTNIQKDSLYNEGLLLKYSDHPYDNFGVAMRNVKEVYHLEYLSEPQLTYSIWETADMLNVNNAALLGHLVKRFRQQGDAATADKLYKTLRQAIINSRREDSNKTAFLENLDKQAGITK